MRGIPIPIRRTSARPPRALAWTVLVGSATAIGLAGLAATAIVLSSSNVQITAAPPAFWAALWLGCAVAIGNICIRAIRFVFLMRRTGVRIPIRDAVLGYFAGFSLLFVPLLLGEAAMRAYVLRTRAGVTPTTTVLVNIWERLFDASSLALIVAIAFFVQAEPWWLRGAIGAVVLAVLLQLDHTWLVGILSSLAAWVLPGIVLWMLGNAAAPHALTFGGAQQAFSTSSLFGAVALAPGGVFVVGQGLLNDLQHRGMTAGDAAMVVFGLRVATVGVATALGLIFLAVHVFERTRSASHFDAIAAAYDAQIPEARREALLARKTSLMAEVLGRNGPLRGLDVGCGQGWYVRRMREFGYAVEGIDMSAEQVAIALRNIGDPSAVRTGSVLAIPAPDASCDFVYTINVLHHLGSVADQRRAFTELGRVLKPGGVLFVHEINTRNLVFRFYMGYIFPTLNCIDEGVERWLLPHRLATYTALPIRGVSYFTFLPEFVPPIVLKLLGPFERVLERSRLRIYSAHFMAVFERPR